MPPRLPPALAWPLRPSEVKEALGESAGSVRVVWASWHRKPSSTPLRATWDPEYPAVIGGWVGKGATLWIEPIDRADAERVRRHVRDRTLGQACDWLSQAVAAGEGWQATKHQVEWPAVPNDL